MQLTVFIGLCAGQDGEVVFEEVVNGFLDTTVLRLFLGKCSDRGDGNTNDQVMVDIFLRP